VGGVVRSSKGVVQVKLEGRSARISERSASREPWLFYSAKPHYSVQLANQTLKDFYYRPAHTAIDEFVDGE